MFNHRSNSPPTITLGGGETSSLRNSSCGGWSGSAKVFGVSVLFLCMLQPSEKSIERGKKVVYKSWNGMP